MLAVRCTSTRATGSWVEDSFENMLKEEVASSIFFGFLCSKIRGEKRRLYSEDRLSLVLLCRRHACDMPGMAWDTVTAYVNIHCRIIITAGLPAKLNWVQLRRQAGGFQRLSAMKIFYVNIICRRPVRWLDPYLQVKWLKLLQFDLYLRKFEYVGDPSQVRRGSTVLTGDYVTGGPAGYENQALWSNHGLAPRISSSLAQF